MFLYIYDNADVTFSGNGAPASALVTSYNTAVVNDPGWIKIETHTHYSAHTHTNTHIRTQTHTHFTAH